MATPRWDYRQAGDTLTAYSAQLKRPGGTLVDLTGSQTVTFVMKLDSDETVKVNTAATVDNAALAKVSYDFAAADVDTAGTYRAQWIVTDGGETETIPPNDDDRPYIVIQ